MCFFFIFSFPCFLTLEIIRQCTVNSVVQPWWAMVHLMVVHVVMAGSGTILHHQVILLLSSVPLCPILRVTMLHHQDAPSSCWCGVVWEARWLLAHHHRWHRWHKSPSVGCNGSVPHAQVAAAAVHTTVHTPMVGAAVVVPDAFGGGAAELVELLKVLGKGGIGQVAWGGPAQSAELVVWRLKTRVEEGRVKVISVDK